MFTKPDLEFPLKDTTTIESAIQQLTLGTIQSC